MSNDTVKQGRRHVAFDTSYSACSLEACPDRLGLFACGTYQVTKHEEQEASAATTQEHDEDEVTSSTSPAFSRKGQCLLFQANVEDDGQVSMCVLDALRELSRKCAHTSQPQGPSCKGLTAQLSST